VACEVILSQDNPTTDALKKCATEAKHHEETLRIVVQILEEEKEDLERTHERETFEMREVWKQRVREAQKAEEDAKRRANEMEQKM